MVLAYHCSGKYDPICNIYIYHLHRENIDKY